MGNPKYQKGFEVTLHPDVLGLPRKWAQSRMVFVVSMGDLLHEVAPIEFITQVIATMAAPPQHTYQTFTLALGGSALRLEPSDWHRLSSV